MPTFRYNRQDAYPDLNIEVGLTMDGMRTLKYTAHAWLKATGRPGAREKWRRDFWEWAENRELDAYSPRYGMRRTDNSSAFDCYLRSWQAVADFTIHWIGVEAFGSALQTSSETHERYAGSIRDLNRKLEALLAEVATIKQLALAQQLSNQQLGLALIGNSIKLLDAKVTTRSV